MKFPLESIQIRDENAMSQAQQRWDSIAKPLNGLGLLEKQVVQLAGIQKTAHVKVEKRAVVVFCADHGIVAQGITQAPQEVTSIVTENMASGRTSLCAMAKIANARVIPVNIGCKRPVVGEGILQKNVAPGTKDFSQSPAMSLEEVEKAIKIGMDLVKSCQEEGYHILATGEMGIGNTSTASAVAAALCEKTAKEVTGRGAGLDDIRLQRKIQIIDQALQLHKPNSKDPLDVLHKVGGLDLAGLCGVFLGGALYGMPILVDGFISATAALCAKRLCPQATDFMLASHHSKEPATTLILEELQLNAILHGEFALGEGTGAVMLFPLLDMALSVYENMCSFEETEVRPYEKF